MLPRLVLEALVICNLVVLAGESGTRGTRARTRSVGLDVLVELKGEYALKGNRVIYIA